tara:strand:- start:487 stop:1152 length:666 start_codon:yes stop_codon:yes gene_type:complete
MRKEVALNNKFKFKVYRPCKYCREVKEISEFTKEKSSIWGVSRRCKECTRFNSKKYKQKQEVQKRIKEYRRLETTKQKARDYRKTEVCKIKNKEYTERKRDVINENSRRYVKNNPEKRKESVRLYAEKNPHIRAKSKAKRRTLEKNATPDWADQSKIKELYLGAKELERLTGLKYEVDHIEPLNGKNVCGLHVWENLQILEASLNRKKSNKENYYIKIEEI